MRGSPLRSFATLGRPLVLLLSLSLSPWAGCATAPPPRVPPPDPTAALASAGKKVDYAIAETKRIMQRSRSADYLPDLYMRLAELYTERARYAWLIVYERHKQRGDTSRALEAPEARLLKNLAIGTYDRLLREFPQYARNDEALFLMAHEYRELGEFDSMKKTYERLIAEYPRSPHHLDAYLVLGDSAFDKNDLVRAEQYYNLVLAAPDSPVHPLARYKLGWVRVNREDCKGAASLFEKILRDKATPHEEKSLVRTQRTLNIAREALVDLAYCYPDVYPDRPAAPYLRSLAAGSSDYIAAMRRVANRFFLKAMHVQAVSALREVLTAAISDDDAVETVRKLYDNISRGKVYDKPAADIERVGRVLEARAYDVRVSPAARDKLITEFEIYARDIATRAHVVAKEGKLPAQYASAAAGYATYLGYFPKSPARAEIEENRAEALLAAGKLYDAGRAFEAVELVSTVADAKKQARLNAIQAYQQALERETLSSAQRYGARAGIRSVGRHIIEETPADPNVIGIKLSIARGYYDSGEYRKAAELFYALARQYPTTQEATVSGHLALDALRLDEDLEGLTTIGRLMIANARLGDARFKSEIGDIVAKTEQRQVTELTVTGGEEREEQLLSMANRNKGSQLGEQALYNALLVARTDGDTDKFYQLGEEFLAQYPKSQNYANVANALSTVATDRADYGQAAQYLTAAYNADTNGKEALDRLTLAASIRALLGDAAVAGDLKLLITRGSPRVDELLMLTARSGNLTAVEDVLITTSYSSTVADFLRGFFAHQRGDREDAEKQLTAALRPRGEGELMSEALARSQFLLGELGYDAFVDAAPGSDFGKSLQQKSELLAAAEKSYSRAVGSRDPRWALAAVARVADIYGRFAEFLRDLKLPEELPQADRDQLKQALAVKVEEAQKHAADLRAACARKARDVTVLSDAARSCLTEQRFADKIPMFAQVPKIPRWRRGDPPGAAQIRQSLLKNPRNADALARLGEFYLGAGDLGMALLILDRAEELDGKSSNIQNLRGVALHRAGDPDGAFTAFKKAVALDGSNMRARLNLAAHYATFGFVKEAQAELKKAGAVVVRGDVGEHPDLANLTRIANAPPAPAPGGAP